ncbi:glycosyl hydrolase [Autumnicola edwardsiae]|uniref:Glycosyl hydrolase n=1 Tax=Autumnicola edwardsiae TaxID=3075594 RepID=A0ABU3CXH8_9FLAO|nr:glycosyl hydrolase [Zunongwangia sp. F297]MDT0651059.1 glycosyl hydrolase [Zunongwangia sp. F297]
MRRREFLLQGTVFTVGGMLLYNTPAMARNIFKEDATELSDNLYQLFKDPPPNYRPFVRWWWNGNKIERNELARELELLKDVGIGGVEINPISFPSNTDDMNITSVEWLSDEWIDLLKFTFDKAKSLDMTCDLLAGTGFPFGSKVLEGEERSQIVVIAVKKIKGPADREFSLFDLYAEADPEIYNSYSGRKVEMLSLKLVPDPLNDIKDVIDLSDQIVNETIKISIPKDSSYALYALVEIEGFMGVIQGVSKVPVLNHFDSDAVNKYLNHITDRIESRIGPIGSDIRAFFADSLEVEGANWTSGMVEEFKKRRGYDILPFLPFILFKIGRMGNTIDENYTVGFSPEFNNMIERMRFDFALTKAELFHDSFILNYTKWCTENNVKSRAQAYGRNYFLLEGSFEIDIPECETWLKYGLGEDIAEEDFTQYPWHLGRGNTMINKYVSSAAHLKDKNIVSSEELTNTAMVFNESLEIFKIAGDQSAVSGVTHPIFHGFNYSPKSATFPGWITYGGYFSENNTMWPYFKNYTDYRARLSALFQQSTMFADIAVLPPIPDMWGEVGAQMEPFPTVVSPNYQSLVWEAIHQNGNACDYVSEKVISDSKISKGFMSYGKRKYNILFLIEIHSLNPATAKRIYDFIENGGRVFCIEAYPEKSLGWNNHIRNDQEVKNWVAKMKDYPNRFIFLKKPRPENSFIDWFKDIQEKYKISPYVSIESPKSFINQVRYQSDSAEIFMFNNSSNKHDCELNVNFSEKIFKNKQAWLWDAVTGDRFRLKLSKGNLKIDLGPADSKLIVFDQNKKGKDWKPKPENGSGSKILNNTWDLELHYIDGKKVDTEIKTLNDLKDDPEYSHFGGTATYKSTFEVHDKKAFHYLNLGKVHGISEVIINGRNAGTQWYGKRIYDLKDLLENGENLLEIKVITVMVNYMKSLENNQIAQYWTNEGRKNQPLQSIGLEGPVTIY